MREYYKVNINHLGALLLPTFLRGELMLAFIGAMLAPAEDIQASIVEKIGSVDVDNYTAVARLQSLLNKHFDPLLCRVRVRTLEKPASGILYRRSAKRPLRVPTLITRRGYSGVTQPDFAIVLPYGFTLSPSEESRLRVLVNQNKLASKKYIIINE